MNIIRLAQREAEYVLRHCHPVELERLDIETLNGNSTDAFCFYGQLTGDPDSQRAIELICQSTGKVICNDVNNDGKVVSVSELRVFLDSDDLESDEKGLVMKEDGTIVDAGKRSLYYVSPLEAYIPSEDHPERKQRIADIGEWLSM